MTAEQVEQMIADIAETLRFYLTAQGIAGVRVSIVCADDKRRVLNYPEGER